MRPWLSRRLLERGQQDERREPAEVGRRGGRGDVTGLVHGHGAAGDLPAVQAFLHRLADVLRHHLGEVVGGLVDVHRHRADADVQAGTRRPNRLVLGPSTAARLLR